VNEQASTFEILIAEDDATSRGLLERMLAKWGYNVTACTDGAEAWEILQRKQRPRLALLDWLMPRMSGVEVCRRVRTQERTDYVYTLLLTIKDTHDDLIEGMEAGADDYLTKPFDPRELQVRLRNGKRILELHERLLAENRAKEEAVEALARSNEDLQQFAYVASHDLQEPLRTVGSFVELLAKRYRGKMDQDADDFINFALEGVGRMRRLIRGLLDYSRVDTRRTDLAPVSCEESLQGALSDLEVAIRESGAEVTSDRLPIVMGDEAQLAQLFQNLIGNAIAYRAERTPKVHVSARQEESDWVFSVEDNGVGIPPDALTGIFDPFRRLDTSHNGAGMGLAICRRIVRRHGGRIWAESQPGEGATFFFTMPVMA
jgi:light-regulated signal transduction histidine kinase (bacteriophytochrome)